LDSGKIVLLYSADLSSAFDLLRSNILVGKLIEIGVEHKLISLILNFLSDRFAYIDIDDHVSNLTRLDYGCVQGSVLGPILFNIYVSELGKLLLSTHQAFTVSYADDSYVMFSCAKNEINTGLNTLELISKTHLDFLNKLGMSVNKSKTEFVAFGYHGPPLSFSFGGAQLINKHSMKILGINFQSNMKWVSHTNKVAKKISSFTYALRVLRLYLTKKQHLQVINAHVLSHLSFGMPIWAYNSTKYHSTG